MRLPRPKLVLFVLVIAVLICVTFFAFVAFLKSNAFEHYKSDLAQHEEECYSAANTDHRKHTKDCESFLYRTTDDPVAAFTAGLFVFTFALAVATGILIYVTLFGILEQGRSTERLFVLDQRPWINVQLTLRDDTPVFDHDGHMKLKFRVVVRNVGKSPAFQVGNGWMVHIGYEGAEDAFHSIRAFTANQSYSKGRTIFPGDDASWDANESVAKSQIDEGKITEKKGMGGAMQFIIVSYQYNSGFSEEVLETVRMYSFGVGYSQGVLPSSEEEARGKKVQIRLWKELVT